MAWLLSRRGVHLALLVAVTALAYAQSLRGGFVSDDVTNVAENPLLRSLSLANLRAIATSFDDANYIPLKVLSLAVDQRLWGPQPSGYHLTNLVLHIACALAIYVLLRRMGEVDALALAVALLWAVHPVHVESVAWISERKNVLSTLFVLLAFHVYVRHSREPRVGRWALVFFLYVCALLSKINTIVLPALMLGYELTTRRRLRWRDVAAALPLLAAGAGLAWVNLAGNPSHGATYHGGSLAATLRMSATVVPRYLGLAFAPLCLRTYYAVPLPGSWLDPPVLVGVATVLLLGAVTLVAIARGRIEGFWLCWFGVTLAPMLNLVPFPARMADRYLYLPLLGLLVVATRQVRALGRSVRSVRVATPAIAAAVVVALTWLTIRRVPVWHDEISLWADWGVHEPYISADRPWGPPPRPQQVRILREALAKHPDRAVLHNNLGAFAFEEGRVADAITSLERARALDPSDPAIALNLGRAYLLAGRSADAVRTLEAAAALEPPSFYAQLNLARAYRQQGDTTRAALALERARAIYPDRVPRS